MRDLSLIGIKAMSREYTTTLFSETLSVEWDGNVYVSPSNGQQHARIADAMRVECEALVLSGGDDPQEFADDIDDAIASAASSETGCITWDEIDGIGMLTLAWDGGDVDTAEWGDPIRANSDSSQIAGQFGLDADSHDGEHIFVSRKAGE